VLLGGHLPIDVPVEAGGGEGVEGGAVGHQGVARVVDGECPSNDGPLVRQIDYNQKIGGGGSLEQRSFTGHFAPELSACGQIDIPEDDPRLGALILIDYKPGLSEHHGLRPVGRNVSVELLAIAIPLDGVERVALQVVGAFQDHVLSPDGVRGDGLFS